jgi:hypothetical protein
LCPAAKLFVFAVSEKAFNAGIELWAHGAYPVAHFKTIDVQMCMKRDQQLTDITVEIRDAL